MASRGSLGGLALNTTGVVQVLDAAGFEVVFIETVGAGQAEVDIARLAHTTLVVEAPGLGDDIQAIKAGILEIADILVVNKADRPGVEITERALYSMLQLAHPVPHVFHNHSLDKSDHITKKNPDPLIKSFAQPTANLWIPPIQRTIATEGVGIAELVEVIDRHYCHLTKTGELQQREKERLQSELNLMLRETLVSRWRATIFEERYLEVLRRLVRRETSPWQAIELLLEDHDKRLL